MVQHDEFKIELVEAETKNPFPEHTKDGKVYVEVEPDIEYFISVQKTVKGDGNGAKLLFFKVDEQGLGYHITYQDTYVATRPSFRALWSRANGVSTHKALKFTKPRISQDNGNGSRLLMGKVQVEFYEGVFRGHSSGRDHASSFAAASVDPDQASLAKKKGLRSSEGSMVLKKKRRAGEEKLRYKKGVHLGTCTLNYCAALGLIEVGVLPKPDLWAYHRMKCPAEAGATQGAVQPKKVRDTASGDSTKEVELFNLAEDGED